MLGLSNADDPRFARSLALVFQLPAEIEAELDQIDVEEYDRDGVMRWRAKVIPALAAVFSDRPSDQVAGDIDDASLYSLESCSFTLHKHRPQRPVAKSDLDHIKGLIIELDDELEKLPDIDPELREFLRLHIKEMSRALHDLTIRGPAALEDALDKAVGAASRRIDVTVRIDTAKGAWAKFTEILNMTALALGVVTAAIAIPAETRLALEGPPPAVQVQVVDPAQPSAPAVLAPVVQHGNGAHGTPGASGKDAASGH